MSDDACCQGGPIEPECHACPNCPADLGLAVPQAFCRCAGRITPIEECEPDCPQMAQIRAVASAWRPRGLPVEQPPRREQR